ncbi:unnamed protein product [Linum tenue]|uniref:Uncharacterized protein n=1 Tax=Linum tenue TaxID=586396 RepID=A0AAV0PLE7_9ROSI|nr:unnamed protein product [Linum tenue]
MAADPHLEIGKSTTNVERLREVAASENRISKNNINGHSAVDRFWSRASREEGQQEYATANTRVADEPVVQKINKAEGQKAIGKLVNGATANGLGTDNPMKPKITCPQVLKEEVDVGVETQKLLEPTALHQHSKKREVKSFKKPLVRPMQIAALNFASKKHSMAWDKNANSHVWLNLPTIPLRPQNTNNNRAQPLASKSQRFDSSATANCPSSTINTSSLSSPYKAL